MTDTEKVLLIFAVSQILIKAQEDTKKLEQRLNSPFAERTLSKVGMTKKEAISEIEEKKIALKDIEELFKKYATATGIKYH
jgi:hypothetical protein